MNINAVKQWFAGYAIHLFVEHSLVARVPVFGNMLAYAEKSGVALKVITCRDGAHPILERYRPLMDYDSGFCIVCDVDSILCLTDAKIIDCWL